jgi:hypothetical protein
MNNDLIVATTFVGRLLDNYAVHACKMSVAATNRADAGVPVEMQAGNVNKEGWVEWRVLPSNLNECEVTATEMEFAVQFPPLFRGYLLARFHMFDQVKSRRYNQLIFMTDTPAGRPLKPLRDLMLAWRPLISAGYIPFAEWGDSWGPMCFDGFRRGTNGDCPIVWMDHELIIPLGVEACQHRDKVLPFAQPLYDSFSEFLIDVFEVA